MEDEKEIVEDNKRKQPDNKRLNLLNKVYLSSMFDRRQHHLWIDPNKPNIWWVTTLGIEMKVTKDVVNIMTYKSGITDFVHKVEILDQDIVDILFELLPELETDICCINIPNLLAIINKKIFSETLSDDKGLYNIKFDKKKEIDVTEYLLTYVPELYFNKIKGIFYGIANLTETNRIDITEQSKQFEKEVYIVECDIETTPGKKKTKLPVRIGDTIVSTKSFPIKVKLDYKLFLLPHRNNNTFYPTYEFVTETVKVISVQPNMLMFIF